MSDEKAAFPPEWDIVLDSRHWDWIAARINRWGGTVDRDRGLIRWSRYWVWRSDRIGKVDHPPTSSGSD